MRLVFEDGVSFMGRPFGALREVAGEVVFNTGMTGYVETLTDPSYENQILNMTYPLVGNYGVPEGPYESGKIQVQALIVHAYCPTPSHHSCRMTLGEWLKKHEIPGIEGVDTRSLTRYLRTRGTVNGRLELEEHEKRGLKSISQAKSVNMSESGQIVSLSETKVYPGEGPRILVVDTGAKENIVRCLQKQGAHVIRVPYFSDWKSLAHQVDGLFMTNGPGNPTDVANQMVPQVKEFLAREIPIFGICLGHQLLALSVGAKTFKLKYGHRSHNQPVQDLTTMRTYLTSQNHSYAVNPQTLPPDWEPWFTNLNDGSNEGFRHKHKPFRSVQFHPEASSGPRDSMGMFSDFIEDIRKRQRAKRPA